MTARLPARLRKPFHVRWPTPKHVENSWSGLHRAHDQGYLVTDLDTQITKPDPSCPYCYRGSCIGHVVVTHWPRPLLRDGFRDPLGKLGRFRTVSSMSLDEVRRLRTKQGHQIRTVADMLRKAEALELQVELELKADRRWTTMLGRALLRRIHDDIVATGATVRIKILFTTMKRADVLAALANAKACDLSTLLSTRGRRIPQTWKPYVDFVRGRFAWSRT